MFTQKEATHPVLKRYYSKKIQHKSGKTHFDLREGIEKMRTDLFAFEVSKQVLCLLKKNLLFTQREHSLNFTGWTERGLQSHKSNVSGQGEMWRENHRFDAQALHLHAHC